MFREALSPEARHLVKIADLDALERLALQAGDDVDIAGAFENVFAALDHRKKLGPGPVLEWGRRYIAWAASLGERNNSPVLMDGWARRVLELATAEKLDELSLVVAEALLRFHVLPERDLAWWQKQRYRLAARPQRRITA